MNSRKLVVKDLHYNSGRQEILRGVDFSVMAGEVVGIIGPNGSGKTSLFNAISGFVTSQKGSVLLDGVELLGSPPFRRAQQGLGRTFQSAGIFPELSVYENIVTALETRLPFYSLFLPWYKQRETFRQEALGLLAEVALDSLASKRAGDLSGGQQRLLEIARLRATPASLLLLDEPTAGVAPVMKQVLKDMLARLCRDRYTILMIEHDLHFINSICSRVLVVESGRIVSDRRTNASKTHEL